MFIRSLLISGIACVVLAGCAQAPKPLYAWGSYQPQVYAYLKADESTAVLEQIDALNRDMVQAEAHNMPLPPGFRAHLGMLYLQTNQVDRGLTYFGEEYEAFPEAQPYMSFLIGMVQGSKKTDLTNADSSEQRTSKTDTE